MTSKLPLKVINLAGGPGAGKSTTAAGLFNLMKNRGHRVELVTEFAKDLTYARDWETRNNQLYMLGVQDQRLRRLVGQVDWAITDSPLYLGLVYASEEYGGWYSEAVWGAFRRYDNHNVALQRVKPYAAYGRDQTEEQARELDFQLLRVARQASASTDFVLMHLPGDSEAPHQIAYQLGL